MIKKIFQENTSIILILLFAACYNSPALGMDGEVIEEQKKSPPVAQHNDTNKNPSLSEEKKEDPTNNKVKSARNYDGVFKTLDWGQTLLSLGSFGFSIYDCGENARHVENLNIATKMLSSVFRIGLGMLNVYETHDFQHAGSILRGSADILSILADKKIVEYTAIVKQKKKEEKIKDMEIKIVVEANLQSKNMYLTQKAIVERKIGRANRLLKIKEDDAIKEANEMLVEASAEGTFIENALASLDEKQKRLEKELIEIRTHLALAKEKRENHDKGSYFIRAAGLLADEFAHNKDEETANTTDNITKNISAITKAMITLGKLEPVRTAKYGKEIASHLSSFYQPKEKEERPLKKVTEENDNKPEKKLNEEKENK